MKHSRKIKGFTLIELLIVIAIVVVLATLTVLSYSGSLAKARDAQRQSDLKQLENSLALFASDNGGYYLTYTGGTNVQNICGALGLTGACPTDPRGGTYNYISNGTGADGGNNATQYILWAAVESGDDPFWETCSARDAGGAGTAPTDAATCTVGSAVVIPEEPADIITNSATNKSCDVICSEQGKTCLSVGMDTDATDLGHRRRNTGTGICEVTSGSCGTSMSSLYCKPYAGGSYTVAAMYTKCRCQ